MNSNSVVKLNENYIIKITDFGYKGEGIGKVNKLTVFVPGAIPGEIVKAKIEIIKKSYAVGKILEIIKNSPHRVYPICQIYKKCGGCQVQHLDYNYQLDMKNKRVMDCINRIGKLDDVIIHHIIGMNNPYRYRNKVQLPVGTNKRGNLVVGFYENKTHNIVNMQKCYIQDKTADDVIKVVKKWIKGYDIIPYDETTGSGLIRHIMIRKGFKTNGVMVVIVINEDILPHKNELVSMLIKSIPQVYSIVQNINKNNTNVILGKKCITIYGKGTITDYIDKFKFDISPLSFFQVNPVQTEVLYNLVLDYAKLTGNEIVFDAYCGTGTISLFLSQKAKKVYGIEIVKEAVENAIENAQNNNVNNIEFIRGKSEEKIPVLIDKGIKPDVVVIDPPRKGCDRELLKVLAQSSPKKIVYVSCDPATFARDLGILNDFGYRTAEIQPVDMFPHTAHVESVALIVPKA